MADPRISIHYGELLQTYWESLTTKLRGFEASAELAFLKAWVPEEDPQQNILSIAEAARQDGVKELSFRLGPEVLGRLRLDDLMTALLKTAEARLEEGGPERRVHLRFREGAGAQAQIAAPGVVRASRRKVAAERPRMNVRLNHSGTWPDDIHPAYREGVRRYSSAKLHEGTPASVPDKVLLEASDDGVCVSALIEPDGHRVAAARYRGATTDIQHGVLEALCAVLEERSLLESSDHAVIALMDTLRDHAQPPPRSGVVMPENSDPAFHAPIRLVRRLLAAYARATGYRETENFFAPSPSPAWRALSPEDRARRIQSALDEHPSGRGFRLVRLESLTRVILASDGDDAAGARALLQLEIHARRHVEDSLQVHLEPRRDKNKLRQARGIQL